jgi:hypothetical protein
LKTQVVVSSGRVPKLVAVAFVTMTSLFLALPYALSRHPGEASQVVTPSYGSDSRQGAGVELTPAVALPSTNPRMTL